MIDTDSSHFFGTKRKLSSHEVLFCDSSTLTFSDWDFIFQIISFSCVFFFGGVFLSMNNSIGMHLGNIF